MSRIFTRGSLTLYAVAIAGVLAFGSAQAWPAGAQALPLAAVDHCPNDGSSLLGDCVDNHHCYMKCEAAHMSRDVIGICDQDGCCNCLL
jgi:hypothetical protein